MAIIQKMESDIYINSVQFTESTSQHLTIFKQKKTSHNTRDRCNKRLFPICMTHLMITTWAESQGHKKIK